MPPRALYGAMCNELIQRFSRHPVVDRLPNNNTATTKPGRQEQTTAKAFFLGHTPFLSEPETQTNDPAVVVPCMPGQRPKIRRFAMAPFMLKTDIRRELAGHLVTQA